MHGTVVVLNQSDYDAWLDEQQEGTATIGTSADVDGDAATNSSSARVAARP
jgi:heme/copper-type cytochrome/quinol oxidase subunit 2